VAIKVLAEKAYPGFTLLVDVELPRAPIVVLGPNGSGKSTLLRCLAKLARCRSVLSVDGRVLGDRDVVYVPPKPSLPRGLTVKEAAARLGEVLGVEVDLDAMGLGPVADKRVEALSSGEAQRLMLAIAISSGRFMLLDEPFNFLDPEWRLALLRELANRPAIIATHDMGLLAALADSASAVVLRDGKPVFAGSLSEVKVIYVGKGLSSGVVRLGELGGSVLGVYHD